MVGHMQLASFLLIVIFLRTGESVPKPNKPGCTLKVMSNEKERYVPVLLRNKTTTFDLIVPEAGNIHMKYGESITFVCPERNFIVPTKSNFTYATCVKGTTLKINKREYEFNKILCNKPIRGMIWRTKEKCGDNTGIIIKIGYRVTKTYFKTLIYVCYDDKRGSTVYTQHEIHGKEIAYTSKFKERPGFSSEGLAKGIPADVAYKQAYQKSTFSSILGSSSIASRYINAKSFLARGHLSPDADFLFASSQLTTYFYINTCPQWQHINSGNWMRVEDAVRRASGRYQQDFTIMTGTHDVLQYPDKNEQLQSLYVVNKTRLPVPKFVWKIVHSKKSRQAIGIVSINNPFINEVTDYDLICTDICEESGWGSVTYNDISKGYIFCCEVNELRQTVHTIPKLNISGVLKASP